MYETGILTYRQAQRFLAQFDERVGTDRELNENDTNEYYIVCMELEGTEVQTCRDIENGL